MRDEEKRVSLSITGFRKEVTGMTIYGGLNVFMGRFVKHSLTTNIQRISYPVFQAMKGSDKIKLRLDVDELVHSVECQFLRTSEKLMTGHASTLYAFRSWSMWILTRS